MAEHVYSFPLATSEIKVLLKTIDINILSLEDILISVGSLTDINQDRLEKLKRIKERLNDFFIDEQPPEEEDKKFRPFRNTAEFFKSAYKDIGHSLIVRNTESKKEYRLIIGGYSENELLFAAFGSCSMQHLFKHFELCVKGVWQPFGVEE